MATLQGDSGAIDAGLTCARAWGVGDAKLSALAEWPSHELYTDIDRASIAVAEQFVLDVNLVDEADIDALKSAAGDRAAFNTIAALSVFDQCIRLRLTATALLEEV
jgi:hypothetical protein